MIRALKSIPDEAARLCEGCGYILRGLPDDSRCPECAKPVVESLPDVRPGPAWEREAPGLRWRQFFATTWEVVFHPSRFYRALDTRSSTPAEIAFARVHQGVAGLLLALTAWLHLCWTWVVVLGRNAKFPLWADLLLVAGAFALAVILLEATGRLAGRLTAWEAAYRGLRLPYRAVLRGLHYHCAHYFPVALFAFVTVGGYQWALARNWLAAPSYEFYLYLLCAEVLAGAAYLFKTYWIGMRNMMYANR